MSVKQLSPIQSYSQQLLLKAAVFLVFRNVYLHVNGKLFHHFKQLKPHVQAIFLQISVSNVDWDIAEPFIEFQVEVVDKNEAKLDLNVNILKILK